MTTAFGLIAKVLARQVPPRALLFGLLNKLNFLARTGNRRFEFERLYLENPDPWEFHSSPYERRKYERTLACALQWRKASMNALELGCSVGAFSQMLARHFDAVTALDVSQEALAAAKRRNGVESNVRFVRGDLRSLDLGTRYDLIVCAEVLYYLRRSDLEIVCLQLERHLAAGGIVLMVAGVPAGKPDDFYFDAWEDILAARFKRIFRETVADPARPYEIVVFSRLD